MYALFEMLVYLLRGKGGMSGRHLCQSGDQAPSSFPENVTMFDEEKPEDCSFIETGYPP